MTTYLTTKYKRIRDLQQNKRITHVLFPVDDLKATASHTDQQLICTDLKKIQEKFTEQSKICTRLSFLDPPVGIKTWEQLFIFPLRLKIFFKNFPTLFKGRIARLYVRLGAESSRRESRWNHLCPISSFKVNESLQKSFDA